MLIYIFMGGIVSLFLGNPFPHRGRYFIRFPVGYRLDLHMGRYKAVFAGDFCCYRVCFVLRWDYAV